MTNVTLEVTVISTLTKLSSLKEKKEVRINSDGLNTDPQSMEFPDELP